MKLYQPLGYFRFVEKTLGSFAESSLRRVLADGILSRMGEFGLSTEAIDESARDLEERASGKRDVIVRLTMEYQAGLGLSLSGLSI